MLLAQIILVSRLLGLVAGEQTVDMQVDATVKSVEVRSDGQRIASLHQPPWRITLHYGPELVPHDLTVIAFDAEGRELGRDTQAVNVTRPLAEIGLLLERDASGSLTAAIRWTHFAYRPPTKLVVKLDGRVINKSRVSSRVPLGVVPGSGLHVLGVELTFPDRIQSRKEIVFGGGYSEEMPAELTPVAVRLRTTVPDAPASCFRTGDKSLPPAPIERGRGSAIFIINGRPLGLRRMPQKNDLFSLRDDDIVIVDPVAEEIDRDGGLTFLFNSKTLDGATGTRSLVQKARAPLGTAQIASAVGASAMSVLRGGQRRVIVVVLGDAPARDRSLHSPAIIRRYLERVGVPLRVWSLTGPRPDLVDTWGEVRDVSTAAGLLAATDDLRRELDSQRVAWMPVAPLDAFRVIANADCAYEPLAGAGYALTPSDRAASAR